MRLRRDDTGTVQVAHHDGHERSLEDLPAEERADLLDELVHDAMSQAAAAVNNAGEEEQLAYLMDGNPGAHAEAAAMFAYHDPTPDQVVVLRGSRAEVGRLSRVEAASFGEEILAASRGEQTGGQPNGRSTSEDQAAPAHVACERARDAQHPDQRA